MMKSIVRILMPGHSISADGIGLPTGGAEITAVQLVKNEEGGFRTGDFYRVSGVIRPVDPQGYDIQFQAGFPVEWNGILAASSYGLQETFRSLVLYISDLSSKTLARNITFLIIIAWCP